MEIGFVLKKLISLLMMPLSISIELMIIGIVLLYINKIKLSKVFLISGVISLIIFSTPQFANTLLKPLESQHKTITKIPKDVKYILLLGGDRFNRGWEVLRLYHQIPNAKIITSGYKGNKSTAEAILVAKQLQSSGIPKSDIIIHPNPKDTKEEAIKIKQLLGKQKFILITSASHMPRAYALFKKEGLNPITTPTNFLEIENARGDFAPRSKHLEKTTKAWHEYIGILWAKLRGQI